MDLVFPVGIIDRPFKHDQPPWTVDTSGPGSNVLILGAGGSGKTTALQTLITLGRADPHARAGSVLRAGVQQHRADDGGRVAARRRGRRSDRPVRRSPHRGRTAGAAPRAQAHLPRVRRAVDGGVPPAQVRRGSGPRAQRRLRRRLPGDRQLPGARRRERSAHRAGEPDHQPGTVVRYPRDGHGRPRIGASAAGPQRFRVADRAAAGCGRGRQAGALAVRQGCSGQAGPRHGRGQLRATGQRPAVRSAHAGGAAGAGQHRRTTCSRPRASRRRSARSRSATRLRCAGFPRSSAWSRCGRWRSRISARTSASVESPGPSTNWTCSRCTSTSPRTRT